MKKDLPPSIRMPSSRLLAEEAQKRGIRLRHLNPYQEENAFLELRLGAHCEYLCGSRSSCLGALANQILTNKALTKDFLRRQRVVPTEGELFLVSDTQGIRKFIQEAGCPCVLKKYDGAHGDRVFLHVRDSASALGILQKYFRQEKYVLVEKEFSGKEYRFLATREKLLAVTWREPANVVGDGRSSIRQLIARKNQDPRRGENYSKPLVTIRLDEHLQAKLQSQGLELETVPTSGQKIYLRDNSNISTGGDSIDVTDQAHPQLQRIAVRAVQAIPGLPYAGVDIMVREDISARPRRGGYAVLEMNASPGIFLQHFPYAGPPRDVAGEIMDILFPETKT
jgi:D-alanine-D-alanine ligase-like ATP-grasp enzyme